MARYQIILSYDGTRFFGFQRQTDARTVQGEVEKALRQIGWHEQALLAAGRTDTGVHAIGQVAAFDLDWGHGPVDILRALNANLPKDVAVSSAVVVNEDFHPRFDATARCYQYRLFCGEARQPLKERYAWRVWPGVALELMQTAAHYLIGTHDFAAFGSPLHPGGSTIRTVYEAEWSEDGHDYVFTIQGNAFLYRMVRRVVFYLVKIGQGKIEPGEIVGQLEGANDSPIQGLAPPQGLNLVQVSYS